MNLTSVRAPRCSSCGWPSSTLADERVGAVRRCGSGPRPGLQRANPRLKPSEIGMADSRAAAAPTGENYGHAARACCRRTTRRDALSMLAPPRERGVLSDHQPDMACGGV